jgi:LysR family transcriptional activator of nhaA
MNVNQLNYHHLRYFWEVARSGNLKEASSRMNVSQPTVSAQVKAFEDSIGQELFNRESRRLKLTRTGQLVMDYANQIFTAGNKLMDAVADGKLNIKRRFSIGVSDSFAKTLAWKFISAVVNENEISQISCYESSTTELLAHLASGRVEMILSDEPAPSSLSIKAYSRVLGQMQVCFAVSRQLKDKYKERQFPQMLHNTPMIMPMYNSAWRHNLEHWFGLNGLGLNVVAEFSSTSLMKMAAKNGLGIVPISATAIEDAVQQYDLAELVKPVNCGYHVYMITTERSFKNPVIESILKLSESILLNPTASFID